MIVVTIEMTSDPSIALPSPATSSRALEPRGQQQQDAVDHEGGAAHREHRQRQGDQVEQRSDHRVHEAEEQGQREVGDEAAVDVDAG